MAEMRGQAHLEAMRRRGYAPEAVDICLFKTRPGATEDWARWHPQYATLEADKPDRAALRCIVGLAVGIHGSDPMRVHAMRDACISAGAQRVVATVFDDRPGLPDADRFQAIEITDTQGVLTWHR